MRIMALFYLYCQSLISSPQFYHKMQAIRFGILVYPSVNFALKYILYILISCYTFVIKMQYIFSILIQISPH